MCDGDEVTVALLDASSPSALFSTLPTLSPSSFSSSGTPTDVVLSGGVLTTDESGDWTATVVLSDGESSTTAGVVRIEVEVAPVVADYSQGLPSPPQLRCAPRPPSCSTQYRSAPRSPSIRPTQSVCQYATRQYDISQGVATGYVQRAQCRRRAE